LSIVTTTRGKKKHITSSYFKDIQVLRSSEVDSNYKQMYRDRKQSDFDIEKLQATYAIQKLVFFHKGCQELNAYVNSLNNNQLEGIITDYIGNDYVEYTEDIPREQWYKNEEKVKPIYKTSGDL
jgi:hypothetical protein